MQLFALAKKRAFVPMQKRLFMLFIAKATFQWGTMRNDQKRAPPTTSRPSEICRFDYKSLIVSPVVRSPQYARYRRYVVAHGRDMWSSRWVYIASNMSDVYKTYVVSNKHSCKLRCSNPRWEIIYRRGTRCRQARSFIGGSQCKKLQVFLSFALFDCIVWRFYFAYLWIRKKPRRIFSHKNN